MAGLAWVSPVAKGSWRRCGGIGRRIHDLRHPAAGLWLAKGVDPVTVPAWLGHASLATTNI